MQLKLPTACAFLLCAVAVAEAWAEQRAATTSTETSEVSADGMSLQLSEETSAAWPAQPTMRDPRMPATTAR